MSSGAFQTAMENLALWDAFVCPYAAPLGLVVVGTLIYSAFALNIFVRTESLIIPFVLVLLLGGTVLGQMVGVVGTFAAVIILVVAPLVVSALIFLLDTKA
jgi:hypothetical protein